MQLLLYSSYEPKYLSMRNAKVKLLIIVWPCYLYNVPVYIYIPPVVPASTHLILLCLAIVYKYILHISTREQVTLCTTGESQ